MSPDTDVLPDEVAERIATRFRDGVVQSLPIRAALADDLAIEARPAIHALLFALSTDRAEDATALEHHETTAMVTLLGRRFAMDDATPSAALGVVPALLSAFRADGVTIPESLDASLRAVFLEGFVRGREERMRANAGRDVVSRIPFVRLIPGCAAVLLRGDYPSEELALRFEELARLVFSTETRVCIVDLEGIVDPSPGLARALIVFHDALRMIGARLVLSSVDPTVRESALAFGLDFSGIEVTSDFPSALTEAASLTGKSLRRVLLLEQPIRALLGARKGRSEK